MALYEYSSYLDAVREEKQFFAESWSLEYVVEFPLQLFLSDDNRQSRCDCSRLEHVLAANCAQHDGVAVEMTPARRHIVDDAVGGVSCQQFDGQAVRQQSDLVLEDTRQLCASLGRQACHQLTGQRRRRGRVVVAVTTDVHQAAEQRRLDRQHVRWTPVANCTTVISQQVEWDVR